MREARALGVVALLAASAGAACDPVHSADVAALGDEAPGVRPGPTHRPGQPCGTCHDGAVARQFSVAGTIFVKQNDPTPAPNVAVTLTSANGASHVAMTNEAGNFYVEPSTFTPAYPMSVLISSGSTFVRMSTLIGRDASCAGCHQDPAGPSSPGQVFVPANGVTP
jgi:hypothetical protein